MSYAHDFAIGEARLTPSIDFYAQGQTYADIANYAQSRNPGYTKTDLNLRYAAPGGKLALTAFATNVENKRIAQNVTSVWSSTVVNYGTPRTIGVRMDMHF